MKSDHGRRVVRVNVKPSHSLFNDSPCNELSAASIIHRQIRGKVLGESTRKKQSERWRRRVRLTRITPSLFFSKKKKIYLFCREFKTVSLAQRGYRPVNRGSMTWSKPPQQFTLRLIMWSSNMIMHLHALESHLHLSALLKISPFSLSFFLCLHSTGDAERCKLWWEGSRRHTHTCCNQGGDRCEAVGLRRWFSRCRVEQRDRNPVAQMHMPCLPRHHWAPFLPGKDKLLH